MASLEQLASVDLRTHWIAEQYGSLVCVEKDWRIVRIFKAMLGFFTRTDYYQHINRDRVLSVIVQQAKLETDSVRVDRYIDVAGKIGRRSLGLSQILRMHPEMVASFDASMQIYKVPADTTPIPPLSESEQRAHDTLMSVFKTIFQTDPVKGFAISKDDPRYKILLHTFTSQTSYPHDAQGNYWINCICRHMIKATIPQNEIYSEYGLWKKVILPQATYKMEQGEPLVMKRQVVYLPQDGMQQRNSQKQVEVIVQDQQARIKSDGSVTLPNGRVDNLTPFQKNNLNSAPYNFNTNYSPFDLPADARLRYLQQF